MNRIELLEEALKPSLDKLGKHPMYDALTSVEDIQLFMENHVFAVWDFMSLLKSLQKSLTNINTPWVPSKNASTARFINEIVLGEETDLNLNGEPQSHFEMYLDSMMEVGSNTSPIVKLLYKLNAGLSVKEALEEVEILPSTKEFVLNTFEAVYSNEPHKIAASFTFGREDVIPEMFMSILKSIDPNKAQYKKLRYYLERHIELDGSEHGPLSLKMIAELCSDNEVKWKEVEEVAKQALEYRHKLWSGILEQKLLEA